MDICSDLRSEVELDILKSLSSENRGTTRAIGLYFFVKIRSNYGITSNDF